ncbi:MarC family NAAT transporter [Dryocola sp. LX212]|jgi:multiple antibiotic resistance protein
MIDLFKSITFGLLLLLPIANPIFTMILYLGLSKGISAKEHASIAKKTALNTFIIMIIVFYIGGLIINIIGVSIPGLRISGGLIILLLGFRMLLPPTESKKDITSVDSDDRDISLIPLAMPGTVGPGTMAVIISYASTLKNGMMFSTLSVNITPLLVFLIFALLVWGAIRSSSTIIKCLGNHGLKALSQILGFVLISMGVQFIINGIHQVLVMWMAVSAHTT